MSFNPHDLLPKDHPLEEEFEDNPSYFYDNVVGYLVKDIVRMKNNGIPVDMEQVEKLEKILDNVIESVYDRLRANNLMGTFLENKYKKLKSKKIKEYKDKRIIYLKHKENKGPSSARNTGLKKATGDYIAFLDDDDYYYENRINRAVVSEVFQIQPRTDL